MPPEHPERKTPWSSSDGLLARAVAQPLQQFLRTEASSGIVLAACAVIAIVWANSRWAGSYTEIWETQVSVGIGSFRVEQDLRHWVNDLAMALFFFVAGLEIKRELVHGQLRSPKAAALPIACALGGMVVPAVIYLAFNSGDPATAKGWGVPMATDIAFSIGVLTLLGRRVPASLKVFLLTLAIVDDIGAIVVIAVFYSDGVSFTWLFVAVTAVLAIVMLNQAKVRWLAPYVALAAVVWLALFESGVHATIAGVVLGLLTPAHPLHHPAEVHHAVTDQLSADGIDDDHDEESDEAAFLRITHVATEGVSPLARLEHRLHPWASFGVLPLFALANAGVSFTAGGGIDLTSGLTLGIGLGLVAGKPIGVLAAAWIATRVFGARLPAYAGWPELAGVGMLAGIGFTVSLFVTGLAFDSAIADQAKLAVLGASCVAGFAGAAFLLARPTSHPLTPAVTSTDSDEEDG
jgi:NhaA family Na+:H+ antiporter